MSDHLDRREFLRGGGCLALALAATGLSATNAVALPVTPITSSTSGEERTYPIPAADGVSIDRDAQVILVRVQGHAFAFALSCPHQNAAVRWSEKDHRFQCSKHDSKYQPDGVYTSGRATRNMDRFAIRRDGTSIVVDLQRLFQSDIDAAGWASAVASV